MNLTPVFFAILLGGPIVWGLLNWFKYSKHSLSKDGSTYATLVNSAVFFALAFNVVFFLQEVFLVLGKKALGLRSWLYHNNHTWEGEHPMASLMQGSGALAIFLFGLICLAVFHFIRNKKSIWKLFILWLAFHGLVQSTPQVMIAYVDPGTDVGEALVGYMQLSTPLLLFLAFASVAATALISVWFSGPLLGFMPHGYDSSNPKTKFKFIRMIAVGAALAGSLLIVPFRILPMSQAITPFVVSLVSIPWLWSAAATRKPLLHTATRIHEKVFLAPVVMLVLLLIFFQLVLAPGVEF